MADLQLEYHDMLTYSLNVSINMVFQIKSTQLRRLLRKLMRRCSSKWNVSSAVSAPLCLLLNLLHSWPSTKGKFLWTSRKSASAQEKIRALSGALQIRNKTMIMVRYCIVLLFYAFFLFDCTDCIIMHVCLLHVSNKRLKIKNYIIDNITDSINQKSEPVRM